MCYNGLFTLWILHRTAFGFPTFTLLVSCVWTSQTSDWLFLFLSHLPKCPTKGKVWRDGRERPNPTQVSWARRRSDTTDSFSITANVSVNVNWRKNPLIPNRLIFHTLYTLYRVYGCLRIAEGLWSSRRGEWSFNQTWNTPNPGIRYSLFLKCLTDCYKRIHHIMGWLEIGIQTEGLIQHSI